MNEQWETQTMWALSEHSVETVKLIIRAYLSVSFVKLYDIYRIEYSNGPEVET